MIIRTVNTESRLWKQHVHKEGAKSLETDQSSDRVTVKLVCDGQQHVGGGLEDRYIGLGALAFCRRF